MALVLILIALGALIGCVLIDHDNIGRGAMSEAGLMLLLANARRSDYCCSWSSDARLCRFRVDIGARSPHFVPPFPWKPGNAG